MASLILHGDLGKSSGPLDRQLYVCPILTATTSTLFEGVSPNVLPVAFVKETIENLFENYPEAKSLKVINFSVGDGSRPLDYFPSPLARLLDWLSVKYNILFIVSAGNCTQEFPYTANQSQDEIIRESVTHIANDIRNRKILSPAESMNALTVGALHADESDSHCVGDLVDVFPGTNYPSPISSVGFGFRRSIKPDILFPGGRQFYICKRNLQGNLNATVGIPKSNRFGQVVASVGTTGGDLTKLVKTTGTSNAAALASRCASQLYSLIEEVKVNPEFKGIEDKFIPILLKAMLVHGARWPQTLRTFESILMTRENQRQFREYVSRFLGYGCPPAENPFIQNDHKATMIGWGTVKTDEIDTFSVPLPVCVSGKKIWKRLTITLAYFTPTHPGHRAYRRCAVTFAPNHAMLKVVRKNADWNASQRGTVQHEIFEGENAVAFKRGDNLAVSIANRQTAGDLDESIDYALLVTLETEDGHKLPVWQEISDLLVEIRNKLKLKQKV